MIHMMNVMMPAYVGPYHVCMDYVDDTFYQNVSFEIILAEC